MSWITDGYLHLDIDASSPIVGGTVISVMAICVIVQCMIAVSASRQMANDEGINGKLKFLFLFSFGCSLIATSGMITQTTMVMTSIWDPLAWTLVGGATLLSMLYFMNCLLTILVVRLQVTFGKSAYRMNQSTRYLFLGILGLLYFLPLLIPVFFLAATDFNENVYSLEDVDSQPRWFQIAMVVLFVSFFCTFFIGSVLAVYHFVNNLRLIAKAQGKSQRVLDTSGRLSLNKMQQRFSDLAARYLLLFGMAILSYIVLNNGIGYCFSLHSGIRYAFTAMDFTLNLLCVYLQFAFAQQNYQTLCGCLDRPTRKCLSKITTAIISRHYNAKMNNAELHSIASQSKTRTQSGSVPKAEDETGTEI